MPATESAQTGLASTTRSEFAELVQQHHRDLLRLAYGMCGDRTLAEDAVQATWEKAWRGLPTLREPTRLRNWLLTIAANEVRRQLRRQRLRRVLEPLGRVDAPEASLPDAPHYDLAVALKTLGVRDRQLLSLKYGVGLTSEEIGTQLGISASGVRVRLQRVLVHLRQEVSRD